MVWGAVTMLYGILYALYMIAIFLESRNIPYQRFLE